MLGNHVVIKDPGEINENIPQNASQGPVKESLAYQIDADVEPTKANSKATSSESMKESSSKEGRKGVSCAMQELSFLVAQQACNQEKNEHLKENIGIIY